MSIDVEKKSEGLGLAVVIDDEPMVRDLLVVALEELELRVLTAETGGEARQVFSETNEAIALVLLDLGLPDVQAGELFDELREQAPAAKYVLISGYGEVEARARFGREGIEAFLQKPFRIETLFGLVDKLLPSTS